MRPNPHQFEAFAYVVREGSFSAAATRLGVTQSTITQHIANLEKGVGTLLLLRGRDGVELTPTGQVPLGLGLGIHHGPKSLSSHAGISYLCDQVGQLSQGGAIGGHLPQHSGRLFGQQGLQLKFVVGPEFAPQGRLTLLVPFPVDHQGAIPEAATGASLAPPPWLVPRMAGPGD